MYFDCSLIYQSDALSFYRSQNVCARQKGFAFSEIVFCASTKFFEEALNAVKFLDWLKIFGPAQNILGPVKGQGISHLTMFLKLQGISQNRR